MQIGADRLFPAVQGANPQTLIVAPGTSCRQQIADGTGRRAYHPIEILAEAMP
jgi:Fe-S oxidoreductase